MGADGTKSANIGVIASLAAFILWGNLPIYWKSLEAINSVEIMCHRVILSALTLCPFIFLNKKLFAGCKKLIADKKALFCLVGSGCALSANWLIFIWAVNSEKIIETSLGYFINPLFNIFVAIVIFGERVSRITWIAISLAAFGVMLQIFVLGHVPWVALSLAFSFSLYAFIRKKIDVPSLPGLFIETVIIAPVALIWLFWMGSNGQSVFFWADGKLLFLLFMTGVVTTLPMFLYNFSLTHIPMTMLGILQYISPSITFLLGIFMFNESMPLERFFTFICIWCALALYTWESLRNIRKSHHNHVRR